MTAVVSRLLLIADDLTGANDVGAQFASRGIPTLVIVDAAEAEAHDDESCQVVVVNTDSRHIEGREAGERVIRAYRWGTEAGFTHFYKKTDSTLKGNVGSELDALRRAARRRVLPFVPAFPRLGRVTRDGRQHIAESPRENSDVSAIFGKQSITPTRLIRLGDLGAQDGNAPISKEEGRGVDRGGQLLIFDAATDDDLRRIGKWLRQQRLLDVVAGASGLAEQLPDLLSFARHPTEALQLDAPLLVVNGSLNQVSRRQVECAAHAGLAVVTLPTEELSSQDGPGSASEVVAELERLAADGRDAIVQTRLDGLAKDADPGLAQTISSNLAAVVGTVMQRSSYRVLAVVGGDTLGALARRLGWRCFRPQLEIVPGVVASQVVEPPSACVLLSKPGAYGAETVLLDIKTALRNSAS